MKTLKLTTQNNNVFALLNNEIYRGYKLSELPKNFGFIYSEDFETYGIDAWFNHSGLTFINTKQL